MNKIILGVALLAVIPSSALATFSVGEAPDVASIGSGWFSDKLSSNGAYFYERSRGEGFSLTGAPSFNVNTIEWWGMSEAFVDDDIINVAGFEVNIFNRTGDTIGGLAHSFTLTKAASTPTQIGVAGTVPIYKFTASGLNFNLASGDYLLNIGADLIDGVNGDAWTWHSAVAGSELKFYQTNTTLGWGTWAPVANSDNLAYNISGQAVPEPTTLALLAGLGAVAARRKRK